MVADFTRKERGIVEAAWLALDYCADTAKGIGVSIELADMLKYETGSKGAGRPRHWAKALMIDAYYEGCYGSSEDRRKWLRKALHISRGIRYAYMLGASDEFRAEPMGAVNLEVKCQAARDAYNAVCQRRVKP